MRLSGRVMLVAALWLAAAPAVTAQSRLRTMPGYERYQAVGTRIASSWTSGAITPAWSNDGRGFTYTLASKRYRYDVERLKAEEIQAAPAAPARAPPGLVLARGRGGEASVVSPDGRLRAFTRERNVFIEPAAGGEAQAITGDGGVAHRIRNGTATYVYVEELNAGPSVWWSPDGSRLAFLRFDETRTPDYSITLDLTKAQSRLHTVAYPHPGEPNPVPDLVVYDLASRTLKTMDVRDGRPFDDEVVGHYVWNVDWTADGAEVLTRRAPRSQKVIELAACAPATGRCRTVVREAWPASWAEVDTPSFLADGKRFVWRSDRTGFRNFYLYDVTGRELATLTRHPFEVVSVVKVDQTTNEVWYTARSGDNPMKVQLHRVGLDGRGDVRLTDPAFHHIVSVAPDGKTFVDVAQTHDKPPVSRLMDRTGRELAVIARSDMARFEALKLKPVELFTFTAADGRTPLFGLLHRPSDFDPARRYPLLLSMYAGPDTNGARETFTPPNPITEYGFLVAQIDARTAAGRGRALRDVIYKNLGVIEIDDQAAGIRALARRTYVDPRRVGAFGTSYGGYASAMLLARYPQDLRAASASSPVTDYRLYDSTYTERYMGLPKDEPAAYNRTSIMRHVGTMTGDLLIYYGTSDDNVHPKNSMALIQAMQAAGKSLEVQVGPDRGHSAVDQQRMMEFFINRLGSR